MTSEDDIDTAFSQAMAKTGLMNMPVTTAAPTEIPNACTKSFLVNVFWTLSLQQKFPYQFLYAVNRTCDNLYAECGKQGFGVDTQLLLETGLNISFVPLLLLVLCVCVWCISQWHIKTFQPSGKDGEDERILRPSAIKTFWLAITSMVVVGPLAFGCYLRLHYVLNRLAFTFERFVRVLARAEETFQKLQPLVHNAMIWMRGWETSCMGWNLLKPRVQDNISKVLRQVDPVIAVISDVLYEFLAQLMWLHQDLGRVPGALRRLVWDYETFFLIFVVFPSICFCILLLTLLCLSCRTWTGVDHRTKLEKVAERAVACACFTVVIFAVNVMAVGSLFLAQTTAMYCADADFYSVELLGTAIGAGAAANGQSNATAVDLKGVLKYYVTGKQAAGIDIEKYLGIITSVLAPAGFLDFLLLGPIELLGLWCNRIGGARLFPVLSTTIWELQEVLPMLRRDHIYGLYKEIINDAVCGDVMLLLSGLFVLLTLISLIILPLVRCWTLTYLADRKHYLKLKEAEVAAAEAARTAYRPLALDENEREAYRANRATSWNPFW